MRAWWPLPLLALTACGQVKDPTPKDTVLISWDRSTSVQYVSGAPADKLPKSALVDAKIVEGPVKHTFTVTVSDLQKKIYVFELETENAKVSYPEDGHDTTRWATVKVTAKLVSNEAFHVKGSCDNTLATTMGEPGAASNTMLDCQVVAKRPNSMGDVDAITSAAFVQIEGSGKISSTLPDVKIEEKK